LATSLIAGLDAALEARRVAGLWRNRQPVESPQGPRVTVAGHELIAFASNDISDSPTTPP
jgi:hypothetical protein